MALEVVDKIKQAEADAEAIRLDGVAKSKKIAAEAAKIAVQDAEKIENDALLQAEKIKKSAADVSAFVLKKRLIETDKTCRELQQRSRQHVNDAVKYAAGVITGDTER